MASVGTSRRKRTLGSRGVEDGCGGGFRRDGG